MDRDDNNLHFEPSAYLQRLLGRELISTEYIAIAELVKNAYDADAREVIVELRHISPQKLIISDDGLGMSLKEFKRLWMMPGYSEKSETDRTGERPFLGEKGIGRFAADRLAQNLTVVTKKYQDSDALLVEFDWDAFDDRGKKMEDVPIPYFRKIDFNLVKGRSGTRLEMQRLRKTWDRKSWRQLRKELKNLVTPFRKLRGFKIIAKAEGWETGEVGSLFEETNSYSCTFSLSKSGHFDRLLSRPKHITQKLKKKREKAEEENLGKPLYGPIKGTFYYVKSPRLLKRLEFDPGISVYRDGFRVEPYGRQNDDWLGVKSKKASRQGHAPINPNQLFGFVEITYKDNPDLKDVTNREGLQDSQEFFAFRQFVQGQIEYFADFLSKEKEEIDSTSKTFAGQRATFERQTRSEAFSTMASQLAHQLRQPLNHILTSSTNLKDWLKREDLISDGTVNKLIDRIERNIVRMDENITNLSNIAKGLKDKVVEIDLGPFVSSISSKYEEDFQQSNIVLDLDNCKKGHIVRFSRVALEFILDNFLTNALRAVSNPDIRSGKVVISINDTLSGKYRVEVTDNGKGVPTQYKEKLFTENMPSEYGQGMGLYWSRIWAEENGGRVGCVRAKPTGATFFVELDQEGS